MNRLSQRSAMRVALGVIIAVAGPLTLAGCGQEDSASSVLDDLKKQDAVEVGVANEEPYGFVSSTGEPKGFVVDTLEAMLAEEGIKKVDAKVQQFDSLIPSAASGRLDLLAAGHYITPERCKAVSFTNPIYRAGASFLQRAGDDAGVHSLPDVKANKSVKIGTTTGSSNVGQIADAGIPTSQTSMFATGEEAVAGLKAGRVDVIMYPSIEAKVLASKYGGIEVVTPFEQPLVDGEPEWGYGAVAVPKKDASLVPAFNKNLKKIRDNGQLLKIFKRYGLTQDEIPPASVTATSLCG